MNDQSGVGTSFCYAGYLQRQREEVRPWPVDEERQPSSERQSNQALPEEFGKPEGLQALLRK